VRRLADQTGQTLILSAFFLTVLLGMSALAIDVGTWYQADRAAQSTADAAALAAAQALPADASEGRDLAEEYAAKNDGGLKTVAFGSAAVANDTVTVEVERTAPGFFSRVLGLDSVTVGAKASARAAQLGAAKFVAPIGVDERHAFISGADCPCFDLETELELGKVAPGGFRLINLDGSKGGTSGAILADWMLHGLDAEMPLGWYYSDPGAKFNSSHMQAALDARIGSELLFPVYRSVKGNGSNAEYEIVGWIGFYLTGYDARGSSGTLEGHFTSYVAAGLPATSSTGMPSFGTYHVSLVE
jgi:hypothetical protein